MSRVLAVVENSICVDISDVVPGDILYISGEENDPIIDKIEKRENKIRFYYVPNSTSRVACSLWMDRSLGGKCFIHDLKNERKDFVPKEIT